MPLRQPQQPNEPETFRYVEGVPSSRPQVPERRVRVRERSLERRRSPSPAEERRISVRVEDRWHESSEHGSGYEQRRGFGGYGERERGYGRG
jgi:hypothetical protein